MADEPEFVEGLARNRQPRHWHDDVHGDRFSVKAVVESEDDGVTWPITRTQGSSDESW